jgi:hypothetical protein
MDSTEPSIKVRAYSTQVAVKPAKDFCPIAETMKARKASAWAKAGVSHASGTDAATISNKEEIISVVVLPPPRPPACRWKTNGDTKVGFRASRLVERFDSALREGKFASIPRDKVAIFIRKRDVGKERGAGLPNPHTTCDCVQRTPTLAAGGGPSGVRDACSRLRNIKKDQTCLATN